MAKAHKLPVSTQRKLAIYKQRHPRTTYVQLQTMFNCTYEQARAAHQRYLAGELGERRRPSSRGPLAPSGQPIAELELLVDIALQKLKKDAKKIDVAEMVALIDKISGALRTQQQMSLASHLKRSDAAIIAAIVRRYVPTATDEDVIRIYHEVRLECQSSPS